MKKITLITGGVRSGKSKTGLSLLLEYKDSPLYFIATAQALDDEMKIRIARHKKERENYPITTFEEPLYFNSCSSSFKSNSVILLDCLTLWVNNLIYYNKAEEWENILKSLFSTDFKHLILITNEVGLGNIPPDPLSRKYNDLLGRINCFAAEKADEVQLMVAGIPLLIKKTDQAK